MQILTRVFLSILFLIFSGVVFAQNKIIIVHPAKPSFTIKLISNPTTGYSWRLQSYNKKLISLVGHRYIKSNSKLIGAPGYEEWKFHANKNLFKNHKSTIILLSYVRPWEAPSVRASAVKFKIQSAKK